LVQILGHFQHLQLALAKIARVGRRHRRRRRRLALKRLADPEAGANRKSREQWR
jgi:hypothetical protein